MMLFGPAGIPHVAKGRSHSEAAAVVKELGLDAMEVEFVHGVRMNEKKARETGKAAAEHKVALTAHGPYYINLCSKEDDKIEASVTRILDTARRAHQMGAGSITFHAAFYQGRDPNTIYDQVAARLADIIDILKKEGISVDVRPELTGKPSQFGSLDELIRLSKEVPGVKPCIDFSHFVARQSGSANSYKGFAGVLESLADGLGADSLKNLHLHVSGIEWGPKGEARHKRLQESRFRWKALLRALSDFDAAGILICESPAMEDDAIILKKEYNRILRSKKE